MNPLLICLTTTNSRDEAAQIAKVAIEEQLAACAQIEGPIQSTYFWNGKVCSDEEFRIVFKTLESKLNDLENAVLKAHSYDTPQWIVLKSEKVEEKYLKWCEQACSVRRLI
ncbi:divalent-cation tolerance protein CutA [Puniceicoccaceae bacterium K14]|nr:divalent-cation tolerance protein CutA [Puniceicoccaceae bacterium K14]